jgi:hypothetical protein
MIQPITSMADLFHRVTLDEKYKKIIIYAYNHRTYVVSGDRTARRWMERWVTENCINFGCPCIIMVDFVNKKARDMENGIL